MGCIITGAHGVVGTALTQHSSIDFSLLDCQSPSDQFKHDTPHPHSGQDWKCVDISNFELLADAFQDHEAVIHLAGCPKVRASFDEVQRHNIHGTYNALEAARNANIDTFIFASSNHVVGMYEQEHAPEIYKLDYELTIDHTSAIRPDSHYGSSKAAGEAWGRQYAEEYGIQFYALRIGSIRPPGWDHPFGDAERGVQENKWERRSEQYNQKVKRLRCTWQSRRDFAHMVECCLEDRSVTFDIFYGVSDNESSWFDITHAKERVGYEPKDSANEYTEPR